MRADCRRHLGVRRSGHAVRHHGQRVAHLPEHGAHQRQQSVLGVHVPGRLGVQPGVAQPDEVRQGRRRVRRRGVPRRVPHADHRAGDPRRQLELSDQGDREEQPRLPSARPRLRQPRRAADVARPALRQRRRPRLRRRHHRADDRRGLRPVGPRRARSRRSVRRLRHQSRAVPARHAQASRRDQGHQRRSTCPPISTPARSRRGTMRWSSARTSATATRRPPCWRRPAPSAS